MDDHKSKYKTSLKVIVYYHCPERVKKLFEELSPKTTNDRRSKDLSQPILTSYLSAKDLSKQEDDVPEDVPDRILSYSREEFSW